MGSIASIVKHINDIQCGSFAFKKGQPAATLAKIVSHKNYRGHYSRESIFALTVNGAVLTNTRLGGKIHLCGCTEDYADSYFRLGIITRAERDLHIAWVKHLEKHEDIRDRMNALNRLTDKFGISLTKEQRKKMAESRAPFQIQLEEMGKLAEKLAQERAAKAG